VLEDKMTLDLKLNESDEEIFKSFEHRGIKDFFTLGLPGSRYQHQMPAIKASGRIPVNVSEVMKQRVITSEDVRRSWQLKNIFTVDGVICYTDNSFKIILDSQHLREINPETKNLYQGSSGCLAFFGNEAKNIPGEEFSKKDRKKFTEKWLTEKQAKKNPIWLIFARGDQDLLNQYVETVFKFLRTQTHYREAMAISIPQEQQTAYMRPFEIGGFRDYIKNFRSLVYGRDFGFDYGQEVPYLIGRSITKK
jgi:hypothetical protein